MNLILPVRRLLLPPRAAQRTAHRQCSRQAAAVPLCTAFARRPSKCWIS